MLGVLAFYEIQIIVYAIVCLFGIIRIETFRFNSNTKWFGLLAKKPGEQQIKK